MRLFRRIVETGSLRAAALEARLDPTAVSRRLSALEARLGARLVRRSRIRSAPTDAGLRYYERLCGLLDAMTALEDDVAGAADEPRGVLRVTAPIDFGAAHVGPWLAELAATAPRLSVDLILADHMIDMTERAVDVAIRIGAPPEGALKRRRLGAMALAVVASPAYLAARGAPETPDALEDHDFVLYAGLRAGERLRLTHRDGRVATVCCASRFAVNNLGGVAAIVKAGLGLHAGPLWFFGPALAEGRLIRVLPDWAPPSYEVNALFPPADPMPAKLRRFLDLAVARARVTDGL